MYFSCGRLTPSLLHAGHHRDAGEAERPDRGRLPQSGVHHLPGPRRGRSHAGKPPDVFKFELSHSEFDAVLVQSMSLIEVRTLLEFIIEPLFRSLCIHYHHLLRVGFCEIVIQS